MPEERFSIVDRRGRTTSGLQVRHLDAEMARLRHAGVTLPGSLPQARVEAKKMADTMSSRDGMRRTVTSALNREKIASMRRTGADIQMALPKVRTPLGSLMDKGIPYNIEDEKERRELVRFCRLFYATHDLIPLLIDIYSRFPVVGLEFSHKDHKIVDTYDDMFLDRLNYEEFLPEALGREYFIAGEVTSIGHFSESLAVWSSEEILNPDMVAVSKSLFVEEERVQLLVKDMIENLRQGPSGMPESQERPSERMERNWEYQQIVKHYPEFLAAAAQDDGLDVSDAIWSRVVNKVSDWDLRGTPFLLRSFRTLMMEESLNAAQDAVADRLYAPMVIATLGIEDMGDGMPWIPDPDDLDQLRDDFQSAFASDFKFIAHNMGLKVESVFGRETVPDFSNDYDRIDSKLLQAWGIGQALIMGGTGAGGTYASSALNREVCEQLMFGFQKKVRRHIRKRMEIIAEAQEHYEYEISGFQRGIKRTPEYREILEEDPETGEERVIRVPKLLIPEIKFATLNLRDEQTERAFISQLKQMGVPISDGTLAVNIPIEFKDELETSAEETVQKMLADAQAIKKAQELCDAQNLPYPDDLAAKLQATLQLRQALAQTEMVEDQAKQIDIQTNQMMAPQASQMGLLPGPDGQPASNDGTQNPMPPPPEEQGEEDPAVGSPPMAGAPMAGAPMVSGPPDPGAGGEVPMQGDPSRPPESDEMRGGMPMAAANKYARRVHGIRKEGRVSPSQEKEGHTKAPTIDQLVRSKDFYQILNMQGYRRQIQADWAEIRAGARDEQAQDSRRILEEMLEQYEQITGVRVRDQLP